MRAGDLVAGRFELVREAGAGGMGVVWRGLDRQGGAPVALKVLHAAARRHHPRFVREMRILELLQHPAVPRHIAHGFTASGEPYLAMDWIEGPSLGAVLSRRTLGPGPTAALGARLAEALAEAHRQDVVHRDVKPQNILLAGGHPEGAMIVDFGIAHFRDEMLTATGAVPGTPAYMAPEQVRGERVDGRADAFALGCILYESLTGLDTFGGSDAMAVMTKILLHPPVRLGKLAPETPAELEEVVMALLAKAPAERPPLVEVAAILGRLAVSPPGPPPRRTAPSSLGREQKRLHSLLLVELPEAGPAPEARDTELLDDVEALPARRVDAQAVLRTRVAALEALAAEHGGRLEVLPGARVAVSISGGQTGPATATDQVTHAARCALAIRQLVPDAFISLATELVDASGLDRAIDRAAGMLKRPRRSAISPVFIDEVTAGLLDARFDVEAGAEGPELVGVRALALPARKLLGRATSFVGRDRELGLLEALLEQALGGGHAGGVLVTGPAGLGKSRLLREVLERRAAGPAPAEVWFGRGGEARAGSPLGLIVQVTQHALGFRVGEAAAGRRARLLTQAGRVRGAPDPGRVLRFLGELLDAPSQEGDAELEAARHDPRLMGDQIRGAWLDFVAAAAAERPVLIALDDVHLADAPSIGLLQAALRAFDDRRLAILAFARPEAAGAFPVLRRDERWTEVRLRELGRAACDRLAREVLGAKATPEVLERVVGLAGGNAFYLEELLRAVSEGRNALPGSVLAMAQARLDGLADEDRRVLRAASVFGDAFRPAHTAALLEDLPVPAVLARLDALVDREVLAPHGERELEFRHPLLREAAYASLTEEDRATAHRTAARLLEADGERDACLLAAHAEQGGRPDLAARWYRRAAEQSVEADDLPAVLERVQRGLACLEVDRGETAGGLHRLRAQASIWLGRNAEALESAEAARAALPEGHPGRYAASSELAVALGRIGRHERLEALAAELGAVPFHGGSARPLALALLATARQLYNAGRYPLADALLVRVEGHALDDFAAQAFLEQTRGVRAQMASDLAQFLAHTRRAGALFEKAGDRRNACLMWGNLGYALIELGGYARAEEQLRRAVETATRLGFEHNAAMARQNLGLALCRLGRYPESEAVQRTAVEALALQGNPRMEGASRCYLAQALAGHGALEEAEAEARRALAIFGAIPPCRLYGEGTLACILLARGRIAEARRAAEDALAIARSLGHVEEGEGMVRLVHAEILAAASDHEAARQAIASARARLLELADKVNDHAWRESFLQAIPEHARTLALAEKWLS